MNAFTTILLLNDLKKGVSCQFYQKYQNSVCFLPTSPRSLHNVDENAGYHFGGVFVGSEALFCHNTPPLAASWFMDESLVVLIEKPLLQGPSLKYVTHIRGGAWLQASSGFHQGGRLTDRHNTFQKKYCLFIYPMPGRGEFTPCHFVVRVQKRKDLITGIHKFS